MAKPVPLGTNPLEDEETALRAMVRGENASNDSAVNTCDQHGQELLPTQVYLTRSQREALREKAFRERCTWSEIVRQAIRGHLGL